MPFLKRLTCETTVAWHFLECIEIRIMNNKRITRRLLFYESIGFALIITISWLDELISLRLCSSAV
jgi:hypothetical protein